MKILEVSPFSSGICGVWIRAFEESRYLSKMGHKVYVFSSNIHRGEEKEFAAPHETLEGIEIRRFETRGNIGQNSYFWDYEKEALELKPDIIVAHAYRQKHTTIALKVAKKLNIPCFLVTHAPFLDKKLRSFKLNLMVKFYDLFIGKKIINKFTKVLAITNWEVPYLLELGCDRERIVCIPNGIPDLFFKQKKIEEKNKILFLGRIAPIKDIETLIKAFNLIDDKKIKLEIVGPPEKEYLLKLKKLIEEKNLEDLIIISEPIYDLEEKIKKIDSAKIFVLPSKREGMPQTLMEAMARGKIVISSKNDGGKELIVDGENGFLFEIGDEKQLANKLNKAISGKIPDLKKNAEKSVAPFSWGGLIKKIEKIYISS